MGCRLANKQNCFSLYPSFFICKFTYIIWWDFTRNDHCTTLETIEMETTLESIYDIRYFQYRIIFWVTFGRITLFTWGTFLRHYLFTTITPCIFSVARFWRKFNYIKNLRIMYRIHWNFYC